MKAESIGGSGGRELAHKADAAAAQDNYWVSFEILEKALGRTTYRDLIRRPFDEALRRPTPVGYEHLWSIGVKGMLNLNLDRLAVRALMETRGDFSALEFSGDSVVRVRDNLAGPRPFVLNLHGTIEAVDTWVFTKSELNRLLSEPGYRSLIDTCLSYFTVVFCGISVQDTAVGGHLQRLADQGIQSPTHYWITPSRDPQLDRWAESVGLRAIRYDAPGRDHSELHELFEDLRTYVPRETADPPPISPTINTTPSDPATTYSESDLLALSPEELRQTLNTAAREILKSETEEAYKQYEEFSAQYDQAIYQAWYASTAPGKNNLLGYELRDRVARGAFGNVYRALDPNGQPVAVKVLLDEIRQDPDALRSFRRGVRSMRILQEHHSEGMASYLAASEIPAFVVMDWIDGPNLAEAKRSRVIDEWHIVLDVMSKVTKIIRAAHALPERVLHRDIRPSNIMLRDFWTDQENRDVVVLDFDLSWHRGALEQSVIHTAAVGFLAPEQLRKTPGASTRSALVDSFGVGMTLLFLCSGIEPIADQHRHDSWTNDVERACKSLPRTDWNSLPARVARLIIGATADSQSARWDLAQIGNELDLLQSALQAPESVASTDLIAEELAARVHFMQEYAWDLDRAEASRDSGTGLRVSTRAELQENVVRATIAYSATGRENRAKLGKYIASAATSLAEQLAARGWRVAERKVEYGSMLVSATMPSATVASDLERASDDLNGMIEGLTFDRM